MTLRPESQPEELLSALLDGQLSGEERVRAEALLGEESFRELYQQWEQQRELFRELPRYQLDEGFAERVLQAAGSGGADNGTASSNAALAPAATYAAARGVRRNRENWWALGTVGTLAALLLATLFLVSLRGPRSMAQLDRLAEPADSAVATAEQQSAEWAEGEPAGAIVAGAEAGGEEPDDLPVAAKSGAGEFDAELPNAGRDARSRGVPDVMEKSSEVLKSEAAGGEDRMFRQAPRADAKDAPPENSAQNLDLQQRAADVEGLQKQVAKALQTEARSADSAIRNQETAPGSLNAMRKEEANPPTVAILQQSNALVAPSAEPSGAPVATPAAAPVQQVWWVDLSQPGQLQEVTKALQNNGIRVESSESNATRSGLAQSRAEDDIGLVQEPFEAVLIQASPTQMQGAMLELARNRQLQVSAVDLSFPGMGQNLGLAFGGPESRFAIDEESGAGAPQRQSAEAAELAQSLPAATTGQAGQAAGSPAGGIDSQSLNASDYSYRAPGSGAVAQQLPRNWNRFSNQFVPSTSREPEKPMGFGGGGGGGLAAGQGGALPSRRSDADRAGNDFDGGQFSKGSADEGAVPPVADGLRPLPDSRMVQDLTRFFTIQDPGEGEAGAGARGNAAIRNYLLLVRVQRLEEAPPSEVAPPPLPVESKSDR